MYTSQQEAIAFIEKLADKYDNLNMKRLANGDVRFATRCRERRDSLLAVAKLMKVSVAVPASAKPGPMPENPQDGQQLLIFNKGGNAYDGWHRGKYSQGSRGRGGWATYSSPTATRVALKGVACLPLNALPTPTTEATND